jgi:hypothetical protein
MQSVEFTGKDAASKLGKLREWIRQPPDKSYPQSSDGTNGCSNRDFGYGFELHWCVKFCNLFMIFVKPLKYGVCLEP